MSIAKGILRLWEGDCGVPSIHSESLVLYLYVKINDVNVEIKFANLPTFQAIPSLYYKGRYYYGITKIMNQLTKLATVNTEEHCDGVTVSRINAYKFYIATKLGLASYYHFWVANANYNSFTKPWYTSAIPFPFGYLYVRKMREIALDFAKNVATAEVVYKQLSAMLCIEDLDELLGDSTYMVGEIPTSLDAMAYGYLAPLMALPLEDTTLSRHLKDCANLVRYINRITSAFFPTTQVTFKHIESRSNTANASYYLIIAAAGCAVGTMLLYASVNNIFKIEF